MTKSLRKKKHTSDASAKVVDGKLILSLPDAISPIVWQMDLAQAKASALEVVHDEAQSSFALKLKTPRGESVDVAQFSDRTFAVEGLMVASKALETAQGQIAPAGASNGDSNYTPSSSTGKAKGFFKMLFIIFLCILGLILLFGLWGMMMPRYPSSVNMTAQGTSTQSRPAASQPQSGVPMSADDFLRNR